MARLQAGYPLGERALVEEPVDGLARPAQPAQVRVERRDQTRVEVDGRPAELLRADHAFRGVRVPAGSHRVVFTYQDRALQAGLLLSSLTVCALAGLWWWRRRRAPGSGRGSE